MNNYGKNYNRDKNVYDATMERIKFVFDEFEQIVISFSGGKDSGVMLELALQYASETNQLNKVAIYHMDYEAQYQMTTDYVQRTFDKLPSEVQKYWVCLPIKAQCSTSMYQNYWQPWKLEDKNIWCRELPDGAITEDNFPFKFNYEIPDYEFNIEFAKAISQEKKTAFMIGIRTQESLNRFRAVNKKNKTNEYMGKRWSTKVTNICYNVYPLFDWLTDDIWIANARFEFDYNKLYDLMHQAGVSVHAMRVASPFNDCATESLKLYKVIDPNNWGILVGRVNGVNFSGIYGGTTAMGWRSIELPKGHTWKSYMHFLLSTLPSENRALYLEKLSTSIRFWRERGGVLSDETIEQLKSEGVVLDVGEKSNYSTQKKPVKMEYLDDTDASEFNLIPTYKRMCISIMKNDHLCKYMGFSQTKNEMAQRKKIMNKYKNLL